MKAVKRILVPTDFSEASSRAFTYAIWFADRFGAKIDLVHIVFPGTDVMDFPAMAAQVANVQIETARELMPSFTSQAMARLQSTTDFKNTPDIRSHVEVGSPGAHILSIAKESEADLIIIGTRGEHNKLETAFGTVTTTVVSRSDIPVLVIPTELPAIQIDRIAYATGLQDSDPLHIWEVTKLLESFEPSIDVVHVKTENEKVQTDIHSLETFFQEKNVNGTMQFHTISGDDVEEGLEQFVTDHHTDLLVMHSPKRNLFERLGHRSVTRKMVLYNAVPLLVLK